MSARVIREIFKCEVCASEFTSTSASATRKPKYCSRLCYSRRGVSEETKKKQSIAKIGKSPWNKGVSMWSNRDHPRGTLGMKFIKQPSSEETKRKLSISHRGIRYPSHSGANHWNWKNGITPKNEAVRKSADYKTWRTSVFDRDDYTCVFCGKRGGVLHADHIVPFCVDTSKRFDINNGRTLCEECHKKTDTYGVKAVNYATDHMD